MSQEGTVIIIGAGGRMGAALARRYALARPVVGYARKDLDVCQPEQIHARIGSADFSTLVYTAGLTNVDYCEDHQEEAYQANVEAPRLLAEICAQKGARLIHVSTDYVFDGKDPIALTEDHVPAPLGVYGESKLEGEKAVLAVSPEFLVVRVSWLFGPDRPSFPDMILSRALEHDHVEAIADKVSCPSYSEDLATWMEPMLDDSRYQGVLHLSNSGGTSWQAYGQEVLDIAAELGLPLKARQVGGLSRINFPPFKAERPEFTEFDTSKFQHLSGTKPRHWKEALREYIALKYGG